MSDSYMRSNNTEIEKVPASGSQSAPESGTYGEKADLAALQASLPPMQQQPEDGAPVSPVPPMPPGMTGPPSGGLPAGMFSPTRRPDEPMSQQLSMPTPMASGASEQRIQWLWDYIKNSRDEEARQWAQIALDGIIRRG